MGFKKSWGIEPATLVIARPGVVVPSSKSFRQLGGVDGLGRSLRKRFGDGNYERIVILYSFFSTYGCVMRNGGSNYAAQLQSHS